MTVTLAQNAWVSFGLSHGAALSMTGGGSGADMVACHSDPPQVKRYWVTTKSQPSGGVDVPGATCTRNNGRTVLTYTRQLAASGNQRQVTPGTSQPVIYAYGESTSFSYHGTSRGGASLDFASGAVAEAEKKGAEAALFAHLFFMIVSWGALLPWGVAIASRTRKVSGAPVGAWFKRHRMLQMMGIAGMLAGFVAVIIHVENLGSGHFNGLHTYIGIIVVAWGSLQSITAACRPHATAEGAEKPLARKVFEVMHKGGGRLMCFLAIINIIFGIYLLVDQDYDNAAIATAVTLSALAIGPWIQFFVLATLKPDNILSKMCVGAGKDAAVEKVPVAPANVGAASSAE